MRGRSERFIESPTHASTRRRVEPSLWLAAVAVITAAFVTFAPGIALNFAPLLLTLAFGPLAVMLLVWRGAPPPTVAELLHAARAEKRP